MNIHVLHHSIKESWSLFPKAIERIKNFCDRYDSDIDQDILVQYLRISFVSDQPTALLMVGTDDDGYVWGHLLCISEKWFGLPTVTVVQLEADRGFKIPLSMWKEGWKALKTFCYFHHAQFLQAAARNSAAARLFARQGFESKRILMRRDLDPSKDGRLSPKET